MSIFEQSPQLTPLKNWLKESCALACSTFKLQPLANDASFRQYFRLQQDDMSRIVMIAPPDKENIIAFVTIARNFARQGIYTPEILAYNLKQGFMLLSDLGNNLYLDRLNPKTVDDLYHRALSVIYQIQICHPKFPNDKSLGLFNEKLIRFELGLFIDWFIKKHLGLTLTPEINAILENTFKILINALLEQPQVCIHRDYHSRNLVLLENKNVGVLDFQDALYGPITYDVASLLRDAYVDWPTCHVYQWALKFYTTLNIKHQFSKEKFIRWFDLTSLQRHLKILGIFSRLNYRDNKPHYLSTVTRLFNYMNKTCENYAELLPFKTLLQTKIQPKLYEKEKK
ncbi:aminoglycoside phosphotransferase family protein [Rickettsiella grylli]|uniref:Aminoglycoside phosphotransferase n=1 Tax=Rickettsiella grylli TaxID=59196 RepID=A8PKT0_9COXI|nr:phosphotransferase [Rickettsiella grylli]EDP45876.1 aminoglycoside phosphotransferase [Rickettsiella grylli]